MIFEILGIIFILVGGVFGIRFALKKLKRDESKLIDEYDKEVEEGKILMPIDKRDFEDIEEFKEKTKKITKIQSQLKSIDKDFEKLKFVTEKRLEEEDGE